MDRICGVIMYKGVVNETEKGTLFSKEYFELRESDRYYSLLSKEVTYNFKKELNKIEENKRYIYVERVFKRLMESD